MVIDCESTNFIGGKIMTCSTCAHFWFDGKGDSACCPFCGSVSISGGK